MTNCPGHVLVPFVVLLLHRETGRGKGWGDCTGEDLGGRVGRRVGARSLLVMPRKTGAVSDL